jgi:hypothetical protein
MKTPLIALFSLLASSMLRAESIERYLQEHRAGYHRVDPRTQTAARSGDPYAQALLRYQLAQSRANGDQNTGRTSPEAAALARQQAAMAYQAEVMRIQQQIQLDELRRQTDELQRIRMEIQRRSYGR